MATKSGAYWVTWANENAKDSREVIGLELGFRLKVEKFISALEEAGATVVVASTRRPVKRAYLFHWSWKIAAGKISASEAGVMDGVDIQWDHGSEEDSKKGALEMVRGFGLALPPKSKFPPSMTSNHVTGNAIDMDISWQGVLIVKNKMNVAVKVLFNENVDNNLDLHRVGASYGVQKLIGDEPHWSSNGR